MSQGYSGNAEILPQHIGVDDPSVGTTEAIVQEMESALSRAREKPYSSSPSASAIARTRFFAGFAGFFAAPSASLAAAFVALASAASLTWATPAAFACFLGDGVGGFLGFAQELQPGGLFPLGARAASYSAIALEASRAWISFFLKFESARSWASFESVAKWLTCLGGWNSTYVI